MDIVCSKQFFSLYMLPGEKVLTDVTFPSSKPEDTAKAQQISVEFYRREQFREGTMHAERIQTQAYCVLTNRLQFPAGRSVVCGCQRAYPLHFICCVISRQQACMAGGLELVNLNKRSVVL